MAAKRKPAETAFVHAADAGVSVSRRAAAVQGCETPVASPAQALQGRVAAAYQPPEVERWPTAVRLVVVLGSASGAWALLAGGLRLLVR